MQNQVAIVMCNRVGKEGDVTFAGQSVVVDPYGNVVSKADDQEQFTIRRTHQPHSCRPTDT